jgi:hypothetical protein
MTGMDAGLRLIWTYFVHTVYLFIMIFTTEIAVLNTVNWVIFIMDKGCVLCEIQTDILYTVRTNVRLQDVCHGSGAEGWFRSQSGYVGWWASFTGPGFFPIRFSPPMSFFACSYFGYLSKAACNRTNWQNQKMWCSFGNRRALRQKSTSVLVFRG